MYWIPIYVRGVDCLQRFVVPERVYRELTTTDATKSTEIELIPAHAVIDDGWVRVAEPLDYTNPVVSKTMDGIQRYIAAGEGARLSSRVKGMGTQ